MDTGLFGADVMHGLAQLLRTLLPVMAAIGTISSVAGLWRMFVKWGRPGALSLVPFARGWIFGKDSNALPRAVYSISDGAIMALTPIFYYIRAFGDLAAVTVGGFTFYVDGPMLAVAAIWAVAELLRFGTSVCVSSNLVNKHRQKKRWVLSWVLLPQLTQIVWGFSSRFVARSGEQANARIQMERARKA